ncbi:MAG TPA: chromosome segregation protein SMC [Anaerolineales bacterium]|nr:chromosome segregation protein SMC [Anaerolineales bacterium]
MPARFKSLELQGYKTFASRTSFVFAGSVTAIVGPNGSGKSNIADALRWVLGEQSYSLLRGKKTEDMIFAGSEQRPRAGMASATVVFDNHDGWLPIDFDEVAVTRRAYRDGTNEYLLNGQRVRLKDVSELLAASGLAERTYTIIGQGLVDAALALKAEERRRLFEEAAGVGLHRARREEAIKRLEATQRNLDRVQDILAELQPRLRSLERQARRAQEYEQVKAGLREVLREWYGFHWHRAQAELSSARKAARAQESVLSQARSSQATLGQGLSQLQDRIHQLRAELNTWHRKLAELHNRRENLGRELAVVEERIRSLDEQSHAFELETSQAGEEMEILYERLEQAREEAERQEDDLAEASAQALSAAQALEARREARNAAEAVLEAARLADNELAVHSADLAARLAERQSQVERSLEALGRVDALAQAAQKGCRQAEAALKSSEDALKKREMQARKAEAALVTQRAKIAEKETTRQEALAEWAACQADLVRCQAQLDVLDQAEQSLAGYASGAKFLLEAARSAQLQAASTALSSRLEVPAELETAIAAALGEFLDAVLVDSPADLEAALALLEGKSARAALLSMDSLAATQQVQFPDLNGEVVGIAADLVVAPEALRQVVQVILGSALVVKDRQAARQILAEICGKDAEAPCCDFRLVTLRGEVFHAWGPVIAGQEGKPGTLSRTRQMKELRGQLVEFERRAEKIDAGLSSREDELTLLRRQEAQLGTEMEAALQAEAQARQAHRQAESQAEKTHRELQWQEEQHRRLSSEIEQARAQAAELGEKQGRMKSKISASQHRVRQSSAALAELPLDEHQEQAAHWEMRIALAGRVAQESTARVAERQEAWQAAMQRKSVLDARLAEIQVAVTQLHTDKVSQRGQEGDIGTLIEALRAQIEPAELELDVLESRQVEQQASETQSRQALSLAEQLNAQAKIAQARSQEALGTLRRRIEDDFGLVAFDYAEEVSGPTPLPLEGMVEQLPRIKELLPETEENLKRQRALLRRMGPINPEAQTEYKEVSERFEFLIAQVADLSRAEIDVRQVITELEGLMQLEFRRTFDSVAEEFSQIFSRLFGGGSARLVLTDPDDLTLTGIDIEARLPGRREQGLSLLSGGERSLTAVALVFALLRVSPTPFCVLDEVDAMLDEANVGRFRDLLLELSHTTQFVIITHNRTTVQVADVIYGVTMGRDSASQLVSLKMDEVEEVGEEGLAA